MSIAILPCPMRYVPDYAALLVPGITAENPVYVDATGLDQNNLHVSAYRRGYSVRMHKNAAGAVIAFRIEPLKKKTKP